MKKYIFAYLFSIYITTSFASSLLKIVFDVFINHNTENAGNSITSWVRIDVIEKKNPTI